MKIIIATRGLQSTKIALKGLEGDMTVTKPELRRLLRDTAKDSVREVKKFITSQGGGNWPKLSKWTRAQTGRRKALITERPRITHRVKPRRSEVVYSERSDDWNLTKHHRGFTQPATNKKVTVRLNNPGAIKWDKPAITFINRKDSVVPARNVWGTEAMHKRIAEANTMRWMSRILRKRAK